MSPTVGLLHVIECNGLSYVFCGMIIMKDESWIRDVTIRAVLSKCASEPLIVYPETNTEPVCKLLAFSTFIKPGLFTA